MGKLLDQFRNDYQTKEDEIKASILKIVKEEKLLKELAQAKYREIKFKLGQDVIQYAMEIAKRNIAQHIYSQIPIAMRKFNKNKDSFTFTICKNDLIMSNPDELMSRCLSEYNRLSKPSLSITSDFQDRVELISIKIPELNIRLPVTK